MPAPTDFPSEAADQSDGTVNLLKQAKRRWPNGKPSVLLCRDFPTQAINMLRLGASDVIQMWQPRRNHGFSLVPPSQEFIRLLANVATQRGAQPIYTLENQVHSPRNPAMLAE